MFSIKINCQIRVIVQGIRKIATINTLPKNIPQIPKRNWVPKNYEFSEFNNASQNFSKSSKFDWTDLIDEDLIEKVLERYKDRQLNLSSKSIRENIAAEITAVLMQHYNVKQKEEG